MATRRYEISCRIKYCSTREEKFRTSKVVNILKSFLCLYYSADPGDFFLFVLFRYLFIYLSITLTVFYYPCPVNFFGKLRLKHRKENCAIMTSFPWFKLSWTITLDQSASEKSLSYCQNKKKSVIAELLLSERAEK